MRDDQMSDELSRAIELLREEETVRPAWHREVIHATRSPWQGYRLSMSVPVAAAAAVTFALAGAATVRLATSRGVSPVEATMAASPASTVLPVRFSVAAPGAARVSIVGDFNDWNPTNLPMRRSADGKFWEVEVRLPLGRYSYAFMIDGRLAPDPEAPRGSNDDFGAPNSVLMVRGS